MRNGARHNYATTQLSEHIVKVWVMIIELWGKRNWGGFRMEHAFLRLNEEERKESQFTQS